MRGDDSYGGQLQTIAAMLRQGGYAADIRGSGVGSFVYAEHGNRAAELYGDDGEFWVELFEAPHEGAIRDDRQATPELAARSVLGWFSGAK